MKENEIRDVKKREFIKKGLFTIGVGGAVALLGNIGIANAVQNINTSNDATIHTVTVGLGAGSIASNTAVGYQALNANTTGATQVAVGYQALQNNTTGVYNIAIGYQALQTNQVGYGNVAIGYGALQGYGGTYSANNNTGIGAFVLGYNTTGANNTAIGWSAMEVNVTGAGNVAVGYQALDKNKTNSLVAVGYQALYENTTGTGNTAVGYQALTANVTGIQSTAVGYQALASYSGTDGTNTAIGYLAMTDLTTTGYQSVAVGGLAMQHFTSGYNNTAVGFQALATGTSHIWNTALGYHTLAALTTGTENTAVGAQALANVTTGICNTSVGMYSGLQTTAITTGSYNTMIGAYTHTSAAGSQYQIVLGYDVAGQGDNYVTIGKNGALIYNHYDTNATWTQTSDERLKTNIKNDSLGLSFINRLRPVTFNWKPSNEIDKSLSYYKEKNERDTKTVIHGLIAQEVKAALDAEGVSTFAGWDEGSDGIQAISREMFVSPLIKAIQEQQSQIEQSNLEIRNLKTENNNLKSEFEKLRSVTTNLSKQFEDYKNNIYKK